MCRSGATMDRESTRPMRLLIRWGRQVLLSLVLSGVAVGGRPCSACGQPPATGDGPACPTTTLASAVRVQDGGKSMTSAGRAGQTERCAHYGLASVFGVILGPRSQQRAH